MAQDKIYIEKEYEVSLNLDGDGATLEYVLSRIKALIEWHGSEAIIKSYGFECDGYHVCTQELESDEEYADRLKREEATLRKNKKLKELRLQQYLKLKEEFEEGKYA